MSAALLGCTHPRDRASLHPARVDAEDDADARLDKAPERSVSQAMHGPYDFNWRLSGDHRAGPSQVFSTSAGIWLYFERDHRLPSVFGSSRAGRDVLLRPVRMPPYLFVQGEWARLVFRLGNLTARAAKHVHALPAGAQRSARPDPVGYRATPDDRNMRRVLRRWADAAGWTFGPDHWTLDVDIPVSASAELGSDFTTAVRALLASTEMLDRPAQPCFYTNKVLRVIGASQQCDPRRHPAGASDRRAAP